MIKFKRHSNSPQSSGRITSRPAKIFSHRTLFEIFYMIYVDDGAFAFETRKDTEIVSNLVFQHFDRFGLQIHIGSKSKLSKTECVFFPAPGHFESTALPTYSSSSLLVTLKQKNRMGEQSKKDMTKITTMQRGKSQL